MKIIQTYYRHWRILYAMVDQRGHFGSSGHGL